MSHTTKVQPRHLKRAAYLYIRQSTMRQVLENTESTRRQYGLRGRAIALRSRALGKEPTTRPPRARDRAEVEGARQGADDTASAGARSR